MEDELLVPFADDRLTPQARAAKVTYLLALYGPMRTDEIREKLHYHTSAGVHYLMNGVSLGVPLCFDEETETWWLNV